MGHVSSVPVFERFTDRARRVMVLAQEEARLAEHNFIGTEHLLLGLIHEGESVGAQALATLGVTLEAARAKVKEHVGPAASGPAGSSPFTPRAKKVMELSLREALQLGHNYIGTEHFLLALMREGNGVANQVLTELGVSQERLRAEVLRLIPDQLNELGRAWVAQGPDVEVQSLPRSRTRRAAEAECPGCRSRLSESLRWSTQAVPGGEIGDPVRDVVTWWCNTCGRTISVTPEGAPRQARSQAVPEAIPESEEVRIQVTRRGGDPFAAMMGDPIREWIRGRLLAEDQRPSPDRPEDDPNR